MKILFIQISDMHCKASDASCVFKVDRAIDAIKALPATDKAVLIFSGDLVDTDSQEEYRVGKQMLGHFLGQLSDALDCGFIPTYIVPGNHDMYLPADCRDAATIESWNLQEHLEDELARMKCFFAYSKTKKCFEKDGLCDVNIVKFGDIKVQVCKLNSAPFSTRKPDDKQFHFFPARIRKKLERQPDIDLKITIMHHHFEWCEWSTKEMIKEAIKSDDMTFFGHDHKSESYTTQFSDGKSNNIFMGGKFDLALGMDSSFNAVIFNSEQNSISRYQFDWSIDAKIFVEKNQGELVLSKHLLAPKDEFIKTLMQDTQGISGSLDDYFVFPKFSAEGVEFSTSEPLRELSEEDIFAALESNRAIRITGGSGAGKTSLIKHLYCSACSRGFYPLLIANRDYRNSKIEKMFRDLFEEQYGVDVNYSYEIFKQIPASKKVYFVDNLDLIHNTKARENLVNTILESGSMLVYTSKERLQDLEEVVKNKLEEKETCTLDIRPMYKESRDMLVTNIGRIMEKGDEEIEAVRIALDYMVQCQTGLFNFTPSDTLQYIKFFFREGTAENGGFQNFSLIFETNIRNAILNECSAEFSNMYLMLLDYLADYMYFDLKTERISNENFSRTVEKFNQTRRTAIKPKSFLISCVNANILTEATDDFAVEFHDKNTYAYFVAKALNRQFEKDPTELAKLKFVMQHICFGINDTIILFLSFIRSNTRIITAIQVAAQDLLQEFQEWDFKERNIPFLQYAQKTSAGVPSKKDRKETKLHTERVEEERHNTIKFRGIFDYDEGDVQKEKYVILRALKYTQLIGRGLVDQYGNLDANEVDSLVSSLYSLPQKIVYAILKPQQEHVDDIVQSLLQFAKESMPEEHITEEKIRHLLADAGTALALNILNDIAFNATNKSTIHALESYSPHNNNAKILRLMMQENTGDTAAFVQDAIALQKEIGADPYAKMLIGRIAYKHIIYQENIDSRAISRLISGNVLNERSKPTLLLSKGTGSQS